ncbi:MAG TPA: c-type cytochrome domain-containing protein, partial [Gemmataceae bacterium]|nr:c-type cytochrome domain-containing protein [Gemmataceae bacterium]
MSRWVYLSVAVLLGGSLPGAAAPPADGYEARIRPVLVEHCYKCHSAEHKTEKGGLRLDTREGMLKGGESGPAIVPGKPGDSLLIRAIRQTGDGPKMPPKGKLPPAVVADFEAWIAAGAPTADSAAAGPI